MSRRHETATRFIERELEEYPSAPYPAITGAWAQATIELAYAQGDIGEDEYAHYNQRLIRMTGRQQGIAA